MQTSGSQTGTSLARLRFSHWVVPVGYVPSLGKALTGRRSPRPAMISPSTLRTNSRRAPGADHCFAGGLGADCRSEALLRANARASHRPRADSSARSPRPFSSRSSRIDFLIAAIAFSRGKHTGDGEEAGLHDGVDAAAHAGFARDLVRVDHEKPARAARAAGAARSRADVPKPAPDRRAS